MKIAIHRSESGFAPRWVDYCKRKNIDYKLVNAYDSDIVKQIEDCDAFMWHHSQDDYRDQLFAKQLLFSLESAGKKVFPDYHTGWHFDDKVGQKYLLESVGIPLVPSYVFYTQKEAVKWLENTTFPKVFKLRGGAGSSNVQLVHNLSESKRLVRKAFHRGFSQFNRIAYLKERYNKWRHGRDTFMGVCKGIGRLVIPTERAIMRGREKGYAYFQDFIPNNNYDLRVIVIGNKAFAIKRLCREGDFRASGSGRILFNKEEIDERCVRLSFKAAESLHSQCMGYDWVFNENGDPYIVEMCYGFAVAAYDMCEGYWTSDMEWHAGSHFDFCGWMVESVIN